MPLIFRGKVEKVTFADPVMNKKGETFVPATVVCKEVSKNGVPYFLYLKGYEDSVQAYVGIDSDVEVDIPVYTDIYKDKVQLKISSF